MTQHKSLDFKRPRRPSGIRRERRAVDTGPRYEIGLFPTPKRIIAFEPAEEPIWMNVSPTDWGSSIGEHVWPEMPAQTDPI